MEIRTSSMGFVCLGGCYYDFCLSICFLLFYGGFYTTRKPFRISIISYQFFQLFLSSSSDMVIINHLISWHNEQIAMSREWRPRETKQEEGVGERGSFTSN